MIVIDVPLQPLRIPAGWTVRSNKFHDIEPKGKIKVKGFVDDDGWALFEKELLVLQHEKTNTYLDLGWNPPYDREGQFELALVKDEDWIYAPVIHRTRDKAEIVQAVNTEMLRISRESGDYQVDGLVLQPLCITRGWRVTRNQLFDLVLQPGLKVRGLPHEDGWTLFGPHMLQLETYLDRAYKIDLGWEWEPEHDSSGRYVARLIRHEDWERPLKRRETREKDEVPEIIERMCIA